MDRLRALSRRWWREPLFYFFALGALLYAADLLSAGEPAAAPDDKTIIVPQAVIHATEVQQAKKGLRANPEDLQAAIDSYAQEEALYREAMRLGLGEADLIVRRRVVQKMRFLLDDLSAIPEPTDDALAEHMSKSPARYRQPARVGFEHVYFSRDRRGDEAELDARMAGSSLARGAAAPADPFLAGSRFEDRSQTQIARTFGAGFAAAVFEAPAGEWAGPISSSYGYHLVRVSAVTPPLPAQLQEIRGRVKADFLRQRRAESYEAARQEILRRYTVVVGEEVHP